jgi:hypothetical protein
VTENDPRPSRIDWTSMPVNVLLYAAIGFGYWWLIFGYDFALIPGGLAILAWGILAEMKMKASKRDQAHPL